MSTSSAHNSIGTSVSAAISYFYLPDWVIGDFGKFVLTVVTAIVATVLSEFIKRRFAAKDKP